MANKQKILFRADAGAEIGYGHFIRTLALADMLKDDFECVFFTQAPSEYQRKECEKVCRLVELPEDETRFQLFLDSLQGDEIVVLDNYFYTTEYQKAIKNKGCKLVCIDDMHDKHYVADVVVNHGLVEPDEFDCENFTRLCLGASWALLRRPFLIPIKSIERKPQLVICFGGADPQHLTDKVVSMLFSLKLEQRIVVILGDTAFLSGENRKKVTILHNLSAQQMADLFEESAFGILPASTVSMEATSRGLPLLIGYYVDNQEEGYLKSVKSGSFIPLGDFRMLTKETLSLAINKLEGFQAPMLDYIFVPDNFKILFKNL